MRAKGETSTYRVDITLSTEVGELPIPEEVESLVSTQMSGELNDDTGLRCLSVRYLLSHVDGEIVGEAADGS